MDDMTKLVVTAAAAGIVPSIGGFIAMKIEHATFKQALSEHDRRLKNNEDTISRIDLNTQKTALDVAAIRGSLKSIGQPRIIKGNVWLKLNARSKKQTTYSTQLWRHWLVLS